jgi:hypothetical protein
MDTDLRPATAADIVARLTGTPHKSTSEHPTALGAGMGPAQLGITAAVDQAITAGLVQVVDVRDTTYGFGLRFLALADPQPTAADEDDDDWDDEDECEGHESLDGAHMGETVYCDGSCRKARTR